MRADDGAQVFFVDGLPPFGCRWRPTQTEVVRQRVGVPAEVHDAISRAQQLDDLLEAWPSSSMEPRYDSTWSPRATSTRAAKDRARVGRSAAK